MPEKQDSATATLEKIRAAFESVEWLEFGQPFWTATVWFGQRDHATITVVSGDLVTMVLDQIASFDILRHQLDGLTEPGPLAEAFAGLIAEVDVTVWNEMIEPLFTACVSKLVLPELEDVLGRGLALPDPNGPAEARINFVRSLPVVLVGRVLIAILVQAGNLLLRSSRS